MSDVQQNLASGPDVDNQLKSEEFEAFFEALEVLYIRGNISGRLNFGEAWPAAARYVFGVELIGFDRDGVDDRARRSVLEEEADARRVALLEIAETLEERSVEKSALQGEYIESVVNRFDKDLMLLLYAPKIVERFRTVVDEVGGDVQSDEDLAAAADLAEQAEIQRLKDKAAAQVEAEAMAVQAEDDVKAKLAAGGDLGVEEKFVQPSGFSTPEKVPEVREAEVVVEAEKSAARAEAAVEPIAPPLPSEPEVKSKPKREVKSDLAADVLYPGFEIMKGMAPAPKPAVVRKAQPERERIVSPEALAKHLGKDALKRPPARARMSAVELRDLSRKLATKKAAKVEKAVEALPPEPVQAEVPRQPVRKRKGPPPVLDTASSKARAEAEDALAQEKVQEETGARPSPIVAPVRAKRPKGSDAPMTFVPAKKTD